MKKKILALFLMLVAGFAFMPLENASAKVIAEDAAEAGSCGGEFFGLRAWYYGLETSSCEIGTPATGCNSGGKCTSDGASNGIAAYIWVIILNILGDLFVVGGLVAFGFIIYSGYFYIRSGGDPGFVAKAKKTLLNAIIGLIITMLANAISKMITGIIAG